MTTKDLKPSDLNHFNGSERWYKHWLGQIVYTDGVKYVADHAGAYWLIDEIAIRQSYPKVKAEEFQVWILRVADNTAVLTCEDGNGNVVHSYKVEYTDFPLVEIKLYFTDHTILLPSEY